MLKKAVEGSVTQQGAVFRGEKPNLKEMQRDEKAKVIFTLILAKVKCPEQSMQCSKRFPIWSFLEYFAADTSYPVRKERYECGADGIPKHRGGRHWTVFLRHLPQKSMRRLLPDKIRAARDREKKLVEFIVKTKGAEEHLLRILKSGKQSHWLKKFLNSSWYMTCVEAYLEDEEQRDLVLGYLKEVYREMHTKNVHQILRDGIRLISNELFT
ncbi:PWWP domain-containing protein MUM1 [Lonchura striata]|uniref:PWWP domain-containing protein MUM1 n=1 Tax=Lonchura striata TaxID=40157 RepID=A0A218UBF6_9PASE|nr:PWWP domain-containing protein MUM1 [Lonchura striata domestica]